MNHITNYAENASVTEMLELSENQVYYHLDKLTLLLVPSQYIEDFYFEPAETTIKTTLINDSFINLPSLETTTNK